MQEKFTHYNLELEEVLIGTPNGAAGDQRIEDILTQLRTRQIAEEQVQTYSQQQKAAVKERELREAEAKARQQQQLTESELSITVQANQGKAEYQRALQQAAQVKAMAEAEASKVRSMAQAEADRIRAVGEAEADKAARIGVATAVAIEEQVRAYGGPQFQLTRQVMERFAEAIQTAGIDVVPKIVIGGSSGNGNGNGHGMGGSNAMEALMAMLLSDKLAGPTTAVSDAPRPEAQALRGEIRRSLAMSKT
jgi:uncharacterized membrane protein YqiK